jgi:broad specificity phosphatase PhoE
MNAQHRFQGWSDHPLNEAGLSQAERLAARLAREPVETIYASDLARAAQTAEAVAAPHGFAVVADPRLREISFGAWEGLTFDEIQARWPREVAAWIKDPLYVAPAGGEPLIRLAERVRAAYDEIVQGEEQAVVLVSHGGPLRVLLCQALGLDVRAYWRFQLNVASLSELAVHSGGATLIKLNETASGENKWEN